MNKDVLDKTAQTQIIGQKKSNRQVVFPLPIEIDTWDTLASIYGCESLTLAKGKTSSRLK